MSCNPRWRSIHQSLLCFSNDNVRYLCRRQVRKWDGLLIPTKRSCEDWLMFGSNCHVQVVVVREAPESVALFMLAPTIVKGTGSIHWFIHSFINNEDNMWLSRTNARLSSSNDHYLQGEELMMISRHVGLLQQQCWRVFVVVGYQRTIFRVDPFRQEEWINHRGETWRAPHNIRYEMARW